MKTIGAVSVISVLKAFTFIILASLSFNAFATYLGNPSRPDTIWVPAHCKNGCVVPGHYLKVLSDTKCLCPTWVKGHCDRYGNWTGGHWKLNNYVVVNPHRNYYYYRNTYYYSGYPTY